VTKSTTASFEQRGPLSRRRSAVLARGWSAGAAVLLSCFGGAGGGGWGSARESCVEVEAGANLNLFEGSPHVVVLYFFPLQNTAEFQTADLRDLIDGEKLEGQAGERWSKTVLPGQKLELRELLPREAVNVGLLADFYGGPRRALLSATCEWETVSLSANDLQVED
jgi:predicted component of type VI protein secretion system